MHIKLCEGQKPTDGDACNVSVSNRPAIGAPLTQNKTRDIEGGFACGTKLNRGGHIVE